jgi:hypothetical protein
MFGSPARDMCEARKESEPSVSDGEVEIDPLQTCSAKQRPRGRGAQGSNPNRESVDQSTSVAAFDTSRSINLADED